MPRRNRVDPWGDLHAVTARGMFTGNRGCLVDDEGALVRHHLGSLWITCVTAYRDWLHPLDQPRTWTPLFFLDDAVALAAGHRPCGLCRRDEYLDYQQAVTSATGSSKPVLAQELNRKLAAERLRRGRGLVRAKDRIVWRTAIASLPSGSVIVGEDSTAQLVTPRALQPFAPVGWGAPITRPKTSTATVLTPPTSVAALRNGYTPRLHETAKED